MIFTYFLINCIYYYLPSRKTIALRFVNQLFFLNMIILLVNHRKMFHDGVLIETMQVQSFLTTDHQSPPEIIQLIHFQGISFIGKSKIQTIVNTRLVRKMNNKCVHTHLLQRTDLEGHQVEIW